MVTVWSSCAAVVLLTVLCVPLVHGHSNGARSESCYDMQAYHLDSITGLNKSSDDCFRFGPDNCPFSVEVVAMVDYDNGRTVIGGESGSGSGSGFGVGENFTTYECGQVYEVFVKTNAEQFQFKGYMLEARETTQSGVFEETSTIWGEWLFDNQSDPYHSVNCRRSLDSTEMVAGAAATQSDGEGLVGNVTLYWRAPPQPETNSDFLNLPESVTLWVTIVQAELTYLLPISGPSLMRNCTEPPLPSSTPVPTTTLPTSMPTTLPISTSTTLPISMPTTPLPSMGPEEEEDEGEDESIVVVAAAAGGAALVFLVIIPIVVIVTVCLCIWCAKKTSGSKSKDFYEPKSLIKLTTPTLEKQTYELASSSNPEGELPTKTDVEIKRASGHYTAETFGVPS